MGKGATYSEKNRPGDISTSYPAFNCALVTFLPNQEGIWTVWQSHQDKGLKGEEKIQMFPFGVIEFSDTSNSDEL